MAAFCTIQINSFLTTQHDYRSVYTYSYLHIFWSNSIFFSLTICLSKPSTDSLFVHQYIYSPILIHTLRMYLPCTHPCGIWAPTYGSCISISLQNVTLFSPVSGNTSVSESCVGLTYFTFSFVKAEREGAKSTVLVPAWKTHLLGSDTMFISELDP